MPALLGADPDTVVEWDDDDTDVPRAPQWIYSKDMSAMVNYFAYHPRMKMSQRCNDEDKTMVARWITRKRKQGYNDSQIKQAINRFFQSFAAEYDTPAYAIASNTLQDQIFEVTDTVKSDDPILQWLIDGMPDNGPLDDPRGMRQLVLNRASGSLRRYPEVVAQIIALPSRTRWKQHLLDSLTTIVDWKSGATKNTDPSEVKSAQDDLAYLHPPKELLTAGKALREEQRSMNEALAKHQYRQTYRRKRGNLHE